MAGFYGRTGLEFRDSISGELLRIKRTMRPLVREAVLASAEVVRERAYDLANVSAGERGHAIDGRHMRDCIEIGLREDETHVEARIGIDTSNVPYAAHQEFGDRGKPFLRPAIDESREECHEILRAVIFNGANPRSLVRFRSRS